MRSDYHAKGELITLQSHESHRPADCVGFGVAAGAYGRRGSAMGTAALRPNDRLRPQHMGRLQGYLIAREGRDSLDSAQVPTHSTVG